MSVNSPSQETLNSYELSAQKFAENAVIVPEASAWLSSVVRDLKFDASILDIGSGAGNDAEALRKLGYTVQCSDAARSFLPILEAKGFAPIHFNILSDDLMTRFDVVIANAVLHHFDDDEFEYALRKIRTLLIPEGRFGFALKAGEGCEWSSHKLGINRYYRYRNKAVVDAALQKAGYCRCDVREVITKRQHPLWLFAVAHNV
ncbi:MAG: class I SAM-dependent methyltransferase [Betaproteobacteria bacterium]|nr:class I SAM-dependent methyltransferase [Betaproteobacteria bacterium]